MNVGEILDLVTSASDEELPAIRAKLVEAESLALMRMMRPRPDQKPAAEDRDFTVEEFQAYARLPARKSVYHEASRPVDPLPVRRIGHRIFIPRAAGMRWYERRLAK